MTSTDVGHSLRNVYLLFLGTENMEVLQWPTQSPDLNPAKRVWAIMKHRFKEESKYPTTKEMLFQKLCETWDNPPVNCLKKLIASMRTRWAAVSNVRVRACK